MNVIECDKLKTKVNGRKNQTDFVIYVLSLESIFRWNPFSEGEIQIVINLSLQNAPNDSSLFL
jgi:hypothetical protein